MWVVIGVEDSKTLTLKNITARQTMSSPVTLTGTGSAFESQIGQAVVYDQTYENIGQATIHGSKAFGPGTYSTKVSYISSFNGVQEGIVAAYQDMGGLSAENETAVMVKVLINPTPSLNFLNTAYWTQFVSTPSDKRIAESVRFGPLLKNGSWQAVVVARDILSGGPVYRDVFVFDKINDPHPQLVWQINRLLHGDAKVSGYPSLMTSQVDTNSSLNKGKLEGAWTNDLFLEFMWSSKSGTFEQVVFPGMFPDMTRWQAEESQSAVFAGKDAWRLDPVQTTQHWSLIAGTAKLVSGGGPYDLTAEVNVTYPDKGGPTTNIPITKVTLSRLGGAVNGVWEINSVSADWLFIYTPSSGATISSPVTVTGYGPQFEAVIGTMYILDHLYNGIQVGNNFAMAPDGSSPPSKFSLNVPYTSDMKGIAQEGIVQLAHSSGASFARGTVMVKVLINPTTTSIQDPAYWTQFVSAPPAIRAADSVSFGHLLGNNSLQAVVVARDILGGGPVYRDVFVFDNINASHPQLLWHESRLLHGDAKISGYNTVMTSQVDVNSSINKGKSEGAWTNDLFREFKWSSGASTFVQTAFPGFFPDMTRWQAEAAQTQANAGQNTWRNDAVTVAKSLASQFMNWQGILTTKVLSGGGPNDVNATIQVQEAPIQSAQPAIIVTLSRLEGNTHNIWEAIAMKDGTQLTLTNIPAGSLISSPVTLTGTGSAFEAVIGQAVVYDHLYTNIGHAQITGSPGMGIANYTIKVPYTSSFTGAQEGVVVAYHDNGGLSSGNYSAVVVKVLIGG
jgi:hypothetical protein